MEQKTYRIEDSVGADLGRNWKLCRGKIATFLAAVGVTDDAWSQAIYIKPTLTADVEQSISLVERSGEPRQHVEYFVSHVDNRKFIHFIPTRPGVYVQARKPNVVHLYIEIHSRLVCWWLTSAWRTKQLADATCDLGDSMQIIPAAACARSLLETAASLLDETKKLRDRWQSTKSESAVGGPTMQHYVDFSKEIFHAQWGSKFSNDKLPELATSYGRVQRTNILTLISKLAKSSELPIQEDYEWLCNTVHPSVGGMLSFSGPFMSHINGTHVMQFVAPYPIVLKSKDSANKQEIIQEAIVRSTIFALEVLASTLDDALRFIDDIALTTHVATVATFPYWRKIKQGGRNSFCPCRSGKRVKDCSHGWDKPAPVVRDKF